MKPYARNVNTIRNDNRALILNIIRNAPISRADLSKQTGMSKSAVTMITNALIAEGQLREIGTNDTSIGRKPILLDIAENHRFAAGLFLHRKRVCVALTDLKCNVIAQSERKTKEWKDSASILDWAVSEIYALARKCSLSIDRCIGIGVSAPGPLDCSEGKILTPPDFETFHNVNVKNELSKRIALPIILENNAVLLAMKEYQNRADKNYKNTMFITVTDGIGSAIITDGGIYRGSNGYAGEIGHTSVNVDGELCSCGNRGCLEQYISNSNIENKFGYESYESAADDAYESKGRGKETLSYIAKHLAAALINAVNFFDLDCVIIHGDLSYRPTLLKELVKKEIEERSVVSRAHPIKLTFSKEIKDKSLSFVTIGIVNEYFNQNI